MSAFVDFAALKDRAPIEQVVTMLGLHLKPHGDQLRGPCPRCGGGDRALVITKSKHLFYCFPSKDGGDQIKLVAYVKALSQNPWSRSNSPPRPSRSFVAAALAGDVLNQRSTEKYVQALDAIANCQHRLVLAERMLQQGEVGSFPVRIRGGALQMLFGMEKRWFHIGRATRKYDRVEGVCERR